MEFLIGLLVGFFIAFVVLASSLDKYSRVDTDDDGVKRTMIDGKAYRLEEMK